jgi:hypothetical protein
MNLLKMKFVKFIVLSFFVMAFACCGDSTKSTSDEKIVVSGQITFERVPATKTGLDYNSIVSTPVRRSIVSAVDAASKEVLDTTYSDEFGNYSLSIAPDKLIQIYIYAKSKNPVIIVQDSNLFSTFAMQSTEFQTAKGVNITKNLNAENGYDSTTKKYLVNRRVAAPFAILDSCLKAADFFIVNRTINFPELKINWSESSNSSYWSGSQLYLAGIADSDTDEFDEHVIVHEWGHYFEDKLGRSDSDGGNHTDGDVLDPRIAFSEGWGNALSGMVLFPDTVYKDTKGLSQSLTGIMFDVDKNNYEVDNNANFKIGWFSENSVESILYDMFDPATSDAGENWDLLSMDSGEIYDIFTENIKNSESEVTIFTYLNGYLVRKPNSSSNVSALLAKHTIAPIVDAYGTNETNDGGVPNSLPIYKVLTLNSTVAINFDVATKSNGLSNIQYIKISGVSGRADIIATGTTSIDIVLNYKGLEVDSASGLGSATISNYFFDSTKIYVLIITNNKSSSQLSIKLSPRN